MEGYQLALGPEQQELLEGLSEEEKLSMIADWQAEFDLATALAASSNAPGVVPMAGAFGGKKPIYVCLGHANDILIPIPSTDRYTIDRTHVVPEGCTYALSII
jgi:hypothetical protein